MIKSKIFTIKYSKKLTKANIEDFFQHEKLNVIKWAIVRVLGDSIDILVTYLI